MILKWLIIHGSGAAQGRVVIRKTVNAIDTTIQQDILGFVTPRSYAWYNHISNRKNTTQTQLHLIASRQYPRLELDINKKNNVQRSSKKC